MATSRTENSNRPVVRTAPDRAANSANRAAFVQADAVKPTTDQNASNRPTTPVRRTPVTHKDLTIKYMMNGLDAITPSLNESNDPIGALDRMIATLVENDKDTEELVKLRDFYSEMRNIGQPGRQPVKVGDFRDYSVQQQGDEGDLFVRIPLGTMGVERGQKVRASFEDGRVIVSLIAE